MSTVKVTLTCSSSGAIWTKMMVSDVRCWDYSISLPDFKKKMQLLALACATHSFSQP